MSGKGLAELRRLFVERYDVLKAQVVRRLGASSEMAGDVLHDAFVRLSAKDDLDGVRHPQAYLVNTAVHVAIDQMRSDVRMLGESEINAFFDVEDGAAGPADTVEARDELARMFAALDGLPERQRDILIAARLYDTPRLELAKRWGISVRLVGRELQAAHEACLQRMNQADAAVHAPAASPGAPPRRKGVMPS